MHKKTPKRENTWGSCGRAMLPKLYPPEPPPISSTRHSEFQIDILFNIVFLLINLERIRIIEIRLKAWKAVGTPCTYPLGGIVENRTRI